MKDLRIYKWYKENLNIVDAIFDIGANFIPGGNILIKLLKIYNGTIQDQEEKLQSQEIEEIKILLNEIRKEFHIKIEDLKYEIEEIRKDYVKKDNIKEIIKEFIQKDKTWKEEIMPMIVTLMNKSTAKITNKIDVKEEYERIINNRYGLIKRLGIGGQGVVWKARDFFTKDYIAIKILKDIKEDSDEIIKESVLKEYNLVRELIHENIVQYRFLEIDNKTKEFFIIMDYIEGESLRKKLIKNKNKGMKIQEVYKILKPVASALEYIHKKNIVHGDLKPENIIIKKDGKVYLTDFGLANKIRKTLTITGKIDPRDIKGTLPYMSPEHYKGKREDIKSDIWSFGVILYEMLAGTPPFEGLDTVHFMKLICEQEPEKIEHIDNKTWEIIKKFLEKDKQKRPNKIVEYLEKIVDSKTLLIQDIITKIKENKKIGKPNILK